MIISTQRKVCLFLVPRTGTTTIRNIFIGKDVLGNGNLELPPHPNYNDVLAHIPDLPTYQMFAFYRDPVERFISGYNYFKGRYGTHPVYGSHFESFTGFLSSPSYANDGDRRGMFRPQTHWLNHTGITLLDFRQYETRVRQILAKFDLPVDTVIGASNQSPNLWTPTEAQRTRIAQHYGDDYRFFANKGIFFT
jgi:hypothetical protein